MLIKNTGHKIVHIGSTMILPDQTREVDGELTAPLNALIERGALEVVEVVKDAPGGTQAPGTPAGDAGNKDDGGKEDTGKDAGKKSGKQPAV